MQLIHEKSQINFLVHQIVGVIYTLASIRNFNKSRHAATKIKTYIYLELVLGINYWKQYTTIIYSRSIFLLMETTVAISICMSCMYFLATKLLIPETELALLHVYMFFQDSKCMHACIYNTSMEYNHASLNGFHQWIEEIYYVVCVCVCVCV